MLYPNSPRLPDPGGSAVLIARLRATHIGLHRLFGIELGQTFLDLLDPVFEELAGRLGIVGIGAGGHIAIGAAAQAALLEPLAVW